MIVLEELDTEFGTIKITRSKRDGTCTYYQGSSFHSQANQEGVSTCAYVHVMYSIIRQSGARNVLLIGGAGGTLATMLHRLGCTVTVVDHNPHAFTLARKYFHMPAGIECVVGDGWSYLMETKNRYDAIAIDAFSSDETIPRQFITDDFFGVVKKVLGKCGVVAMNVLVAHDVDMLADYIASNMEKAGLPATLFDWPGRMNRNIIVAGGAVEHMQIASHNKPKFVRDEVRGVVRRTPHRRTIDGWKPR